MKIRMIEIENNIIQLAKDFQLHLLCDQLNMSKLASPN